ncbi:E3 ubiquitin-protein ligase RKP-like protein [Drosera capensis]
MKTILSKDEINYIVIDNHTPDGWYEYYSSCQGYLKAWRIDNQVVISGGWVRAVYRMAEDNLRTNGLSFGLAVVLNGDDKKDNPVKNRLISCRNDIDQQSLERTLEHIFNLRHGTLGLLKNPLDAGVVRSIIKQHFSAVYPDSHGCSESRDGFCMVGNSLTSVVGIEESSICGDLQISKHPLILESMTIFSSARANACVWRGKWMYEVILQTAGIQQLGWATRSCPFTDRMGVGDAENSYAFDGRREKKWNKEDEAYGQPWVVGDIIGCCIDFDEDEILFFRNGISLGVAFSCIRKMPPGSGYFPAISLSQDEKCDLNFGSRPFKYPVTGFLPIQSTPHACALASQLLQSLSRLLELQRTESADFNSLGRLGRLKRFVPLEDIFVPVALAICEELFYILDKEVESTEYVAWGPFLSFLMEVFGLQAPHDFSSLDRVLDLFLLFRSSNLLFQHLINALSSGCKTASLVLTECPHSGSYCYLALACHLLKREELMILWWKSPDFEFLFEGFLSRKSPNKHDIKFMIPSVWWPNSYKDVSLESSMMLTTMALSSAIEKIEEKHRDLCCLVLQFIPPKTPLQLPGLVFRTFLQNLLLKSRGDHNFPSRATLRNPVLVSIYAVVLHFLSEGFPPSDICGWSMGCKGNKSDIGFLHQGGLQRFPIALFLKNDSHRVDIPRLGGSFNHLAKAHPVYDKEEEVLSWEEGCMDDEESKVTHFTRRKPCCCSCNVSDPAKIYCDPTKPSLKGSRGHTTSAPESSSHCTSGNLNDEIIDKPSSSDHSYSRAEYRPVQHIRIVPTETMFSSAMLGEEELLDAMLLLYHIGVAPSLKKASTYLSNQSQSISQLEEIDRQMKEGPCGEQQRRLKEAQNICREEIIDCIRHSTWYRIALLARWKQRGMYAACMWTVQLLLILSKDDVLFSFVPEFYLETLVDCFHVLRKSDPPFAPSAIFIKQGLTSFVTFVVTHFNDPRISSTDLRDLLLQSISVLVQYKDFLVAFETNVAATNMMPRALISAFDNRSWMPVTNVLLRLCKGSGFGSSKHGESSTSSVIFQRLLRDACTKDGELFATFLNHLFNILSWTITEFSVSVREMQEKYQASHAFSLIMCFTLLCGTIFLIPAPVSEFQLQKSSVVFYLSCNLARILEFCTCEVPQAFLLGTDMNLRRLTEVVVFILSQMILATDSDFFEMAVRRHGNLLEKVNRGLILAPLAGILLNLLDSSMVPSGSKQNDVIGVFASMDCPDTVLCGLQCMLEYNWAGFSKGNAHFSKLRQLEEFSSLLISEMSSRDSERSGLGYEAQTDDSTCCICYIQEADAQFFPCSHKSCFGCITRHLLNCQRCFFCNATVINVTRKSQRSSESN